MRVERYLPNRPPAQAAIVAPSKILCVGRNYADHAKELGNTTSAEPFIFLKPPSAVIGPGEIIRIPSASQRVDFEGELVMVIGKEARGVRARDFRQYLYGFTCANDVTARDLQKKEGQFNRAKGFDTFCPVGPHIETDLDPSALRIVTRVNGEVRQDGNTREMIFPCGELLAFISSFTTLLPGDLILTGTPSGVGPLRPGDTVEVEVEGIGILRNDVA